MRDHIFFVSELVYCKRLFIDFDHIEIFNNSCLAGPSLVVVVVVRKTHQRPYLFYFCRYLL